MVEMVVLLVIITGIPPLSKRLAHCSRAGLRGVGRMLAGAYLGALPACGVAEAFWHESRSSALRRLPFWPHYGPWVGVGALIGAMAVAARIRTEARP